MVAYAVWLFCDDNERSIHAALLPTTRYSPFLNYLLRENHDLDISFFSADGTALGARVLASGYAVVRKKEERHWACSRRVRFDAYARPLEDGGRKKKGGKHLATCFCAPALARYSF